MPCAVSFFSQYFNQTSKKEIPLPHDFQSFCLDGKITWLNGICKDILEEYFLCSQTDVMKHLRFILTDLFCPKSLSYVGSIKIHIEKIHGARAPESKMSRENVKDEVGSYCQAVKQCKAEK